MSTVAFKIQQQHHYAQSDQGKVALLAIGKGRLLVQKISLYVNSCWMFSWLSRHPKWRTLKWKSTKHILFLRHYKWKPVVCYEHASPFIYNLNQRYILKVNILILKVKCWLILPIVDYFAGGVVFFGLIGWSPAPPRMAFSRPRSGPSTPIDIRKAATYDTTTLPTNTQIWRLNMYSFYYKFCWELVNNWYTKLLQNPTWMRERIRQTNW